jgi:hypothetical protein
MSYHAIAYILLTIVSIAIFYGLAKFAESEEGTKLLKSNKDKVQSAIIWTGFIVTFLVPPVLSDTLNKSINATTTGEWCAQSDNTWTGTKGRSWCENATEVVIDSHNKSQEEGATENVSYCSRIGLNSNEQCDDFRNDVLYNSKIRGINW